MMPRYPVTTKTDSGDDITRVYACKCSQDCEESGTWIARAPMAHCFPDGACKCECHAFARYCMEAKKRALAAGEIRAW